MSQKNERTTPTTPTTTLMLMATYHEEPTKENRRTKYSFICPELKNKIHYGLYCFEELTTTNMNAICGGKNGQSAEPGKTRKVGLGLGLGLAFQTSKVPSARRT